MIPVTKKSVILFIVIALELILISLVTNTPYVSVNIKNNNNHKRSDAFRNNKRVLSYTLFGDDSWKQFGENVVNVVKEASVSKLYGNWTVRLYHDNYPEELQNTLILEYQNLQFVDVRYTSVVELDLVNTTLTNIININPRTWRFIPMGDLSVNVMCSRDLDSPLIERDEVAVQHWLNSGKLAHAMRDYPEHDVKMLAGMWCFRNIKDREKGQKYLKLLMNKATKRKTRIDKQDDQNILAKYLWPQIKSDIMQQDAYLCDKYPGSIRFPTKREGTYFVGCYRPCHDKINVCPEKCRPKNHQNWTRC